MHSNPIFPGYFVIPFTDGYSMNRAYEVIDSNGKIVLPFTEGGSKRVFVKIKNQAKEVRNCSLAYLIALTFLVLPKDYTPKKYVLRFVDDDSTNHALQNLYWSTRGDLLKNKTINDDYRIRERLGCPVFTNSNTGLYPNPIPCIQKPGFYHIPFTDTPLVINRQGIVINLHKNIVVDPYVVNGYLKIGIKKDGVWLQMFIHRIIGYMFLGVPENIKNIPADELEINHKNGVKSCNAVENLEWVTKSGNVRHSYITGLNKNTTGSGDPNRLKSKGFPILAKNIITNKITSYPSVAAVCKTFGLSDQLLTVRLNQNQAAIKTKDWHVFKYDDASPWPELLAHHKVENRWRVKGGIWKATDGVDKYFTSTASDMEHLLDLKPRKIENNKKRSLSNELLIDDRWTITYDQDPSLEDYSAAGKNARDIKKPVRLKVIEMATQKTHYFESINAASKSTGISSSNIAEKVNKADSGVFAYEGYIFMKE